MIELRIYEDGRGRPSSFSASGHAGWDDAGSDVVCAAVSALLQSAWFGLAEIACVEVDGRKGDGSLDVSWPMAARDDAAARAIVDTAMRSVERIAAQYPGHVRVIRSRRDG